MKWSNYRITRAHQEDLKVLRDDELAIYYPFVSQIAKTFSRDSSVVGILDFNDLLQAGYSGLISAWKIVNWEIIESSENPQGKLWSYLKKRIKGNIRREIAKYGSFISMPINKQEKHYELADGSRMDKTLVSMFPRFFDNQKFTKYIEDPNVRWISIQLEELILDELAIRVRNVDHRDILMKFYGIGFDKKSTRSLADEYNKDSGAIAKIIQRTKDKLKTEEFEKKIENFYKI